MATLEGLTIRPPLLRMCIALTTKNQKACLLPIQTPEISRRLLAKQHHQALATGGLFSAIGAGGSETLELPVYLADVVRWYANRNLDPQRLIDDPKYRYRAPRDIPVTHKDHARAWDSFGEMLKRGKEANWFEDNLLPKSKFRWGAFDYDIWKKMNEDRKKVLRILPELIQNNSLQSVVTA